MISDHALVRLSVCVSKRSAEVQSINRRTWRRLKPDAFAADLAASALCAGMDSLNDKSVDELARI